MMDSTLESISRPEVMSDGRWKNWFDSTSDGGFGLLDIMGSVSRSDQMSGVKNHSIMLQESVKFCCMAHYSHFVPMPVSD